LKAFFGQVGRKMSAFACKSITDGREVTFYEKVAGDYLRRGPVLVIHVNGVYTPG